MFSPLLIILNKNFSDWEKIGRYDINYVKYGFNLDKYFVNKRNSFRVYLQISPQQSLPSKLFTFFGGTTLNSQGKLSKIPPRLLIRTIRYGHHIFPQGKQLN